MASFASETTQATASSLDFLSQSLLSSPSPTQSPGVYAQSLVVIPQTAVRAQSGIKSLNLASAARLPSREYLLKVLQDSFPEDQLSIRVQDGDELQAEELLLIAQIITGAYGVAIQTLLEEATECENELDYWRAVEGDTYQRVTYFVQTLPSRLIHVLQTLQQRLRLHTTPLFSPARTHLPSLSDLRQSLPPSVLLTSLFPHLSRLSAQGSNTMQSKRSILFLAISPLILTRQEAKLKREELQKTKDDLSTRLGALARERRSIFTRLTQRDEVVLKSTLESKLLQAVDTLDKNMSSTAEHKGKSKALKAFSAVQDILPARLFALLAHRIPTHTSSTSKQLNILSRPSLISRIWPTLIFGPIGLYLGSRYVLNRKEDIKEWIQDARQTINGFIWGWVVQPVMDIVETIKGGGDAALTLMGGESLTSDLESLQRMVVDFSKENSNISQEEVMEIAKKVREGNITTVLTAWEQDIKHPVRSTVSGSLIRTLLIQVQKVKVDVALAMDGIQKMLRSQQLTFGFVGVAPSMMILYVIGIWLRNLWNGNPQSVFQRRIKAMETLRFVDVLLLTTPQSASDVDNDQTQQDLLLGNLLVSLSLLRHFAYSKSFPHDPTLKDMFLSDIRVLEGTDTKLSVKRATVARMWAIWSANSSL